MVAKHRFPSTLMSKPYLDLALVSDLKSTEDNGNLSLTLSHSPFISSEWVYTQIGVETPSATNAFFIVGLLLLQPVLELNWR